MYWSIGEDDVCVESYLSCTLFTPNIRNLLWLIRSEKDKERDGSRSRTREMDKQMERERCRRERWSRERKRVERESR